MIFYFGMAVVLYPLVVYCSAKELRTNAGTVGMGKPYNYKKISKETEAIILREPDLSYTAYIRHNPILRLILKFERLFNNGFNSRRTFNMRCVKANKIFDISLKRFKNFKFIKKMLSRNICDVG